MSPLIHQVVTAVKRDRIESMDDILPARYLIHNWVSPYKGGLFI